MSTYDIQNAKRIIAAVRSQGRRNLNEAESKDVLRCFGIHVNKFILIGPGQDPGKALKELNFPVVIKILSADIIHKSDLGFVRTNLCNEQSVRRELDEMKRLAEHLQINNVQGYVLQEHINGIELIAGAINDERFGPCVMIGMGGIHVEVYRDVRFAQAPIDEYVADEMLKSLKGRAILEGARSKTRPNSKKIKQVLLRLSDLILTLTDVREVDINPLIVNESDATAVDARITLR